MSAPVTVGYSSPRTLNQPESGAHIGTSDDPDKKHRPETVKHGDDDDRLLYRRAAALFRSRARALRRSLRKRAAHPAHATVTA